MVSQATVARLDRIRMRGLKTTYKHLSPTEKRYIKLNEKLNQWGKAITRFWRDIKRDSYGQASQNNDWDFYHIAKTYYTKTEKQIERFLKKNNWTEQNVREVLKSHNDSNIAHCYGGSFL